MIVASFHVLKRNARLAQQLVGTYGGYFEYDPYEVSDDELYFSVVFTDGADKNYNIFAVKMQILRQPFI